MINLGRVFIEVQGMEHAGWSASTFPLLSPLLRDSGTSFPRDNAIGSGQCPPRGSHRAWGQRGAATSIVGVEWVTHGAGVEGDTVKTLGGRNHPTQTPGRAGTLPAEIPGGCCHLSVVTSTPSSSSASHPEQGVLWIGDQRKEGGPKGGVSSQMKTEEEFAFGGTFP